MFNHEPPDYQCDFCTIAAGKDNEHNKIQDIVFQNEFATAFIAPKWWVNNHGNVLVIPNKHYENIYDISDEMLAEVYKVVKKISIAIRSTYGCEGTSTRQHNEPAGNQVIWHLHVHVFPRYKGDKLYENHNQKDFVSVEDRAPYAEKLRQYFVAKS